MIKNILPFVFCLICNGVYAQNYYDNLEELVNASGSSANNRLDHVLRNEFSQLINANTNGMIGNYVGLSTKDKTLSFAYNFVREDRIIELNFSGEANDGIAGIFAENKFKTGVQIGVKYNKLFGEKKIQLVFDEVKAIQKKLNDLKNEKNLYHLNEMSDSIKLKKEITKKEQAYDALKKKRKLFYAAREEKNPLDKEKAKSYNFQKNIIETEIELLKNKLSNIASIQTSRMAAFEKKKGEIAKPTLNNKYQFRIDSLEILNLKIVLTDSLKNYEKKLFGINKKIKANTFNQTSLDELEAQLKVAEYEIKIAKEKYAYYDNGWTSDAIDDLFEDNRKKALDDFQKLRAKDFQLSWITAGVGFSNESYSLFDPNLSLDDQIFKENDLIPSLNFSFSNYTNEITSNLNAPGVRRVCFFTIGATLKYGNNLNSLSEIVVETIDSIAPNRSVINSKKALSGTFEDGIVTSQLFCDYYQLGFTKSNFGFHLRSTVDLGPSAPVTSIRGGVLFSAMKKGEVKSIINFEIFYGLNDIFKDNNLLNRNILGIQATFPFNFKL